MHVENYDVNSNFVTEVYPQPLPQEQCGPAPIYVDGTTLNNHLFALVTQTTRGEVAIVDLTAGNVVDIDNSTPGINFLPVRKSDGHHVGARRHVYVRCRCRAGKTSHLRARQSRDFG